MEARYTTIVRGKPPRSARPGYCFDTRHSGRPALAREISRRSIRPAIRTRPGPLFFFIFFLVPRPVVDVDRPRRQISLEIPHERSTCTMHVHTCCANDGGVADLRSVTHVCVADRSRVHLHRCTCAAACVGCARMLIACARSSVGEGERGRGGVAADRSAYFARDVELRASWAANVELQSRRDMREGGGATLLHHRELTAPINNRSDGIDRGSVSHLESRCPPRGIYTGLFSARTPFLYVFHSLVVKRAIVYSATHTKFQKGSLQLQVIK